jgi:ferric-dicitrate binding protein FerR (iron transport regulator)
MSDARYPRLLARAFARRAARESKVLDPARCADEIDLVQHVLDRVTVRRRGRLFAGAFGALLLLAGGLALRHSLDRQKDEPHVATDVAAPSLEVVASSTGQGTMVVSSESSVPLDAAMPLAPGSRLLVGPVAGANLALSTGSRLAIEPGSDVTVTGEGRSAIFELSAGSLRADVAKLTGTDRFVVHTVDSEVEVRGTSFRVSVVLPDPACGEGTTTHVKVYEGTVVVRRKGHEESVEKGEEWPRGCAEALAPRPAPAVGTAIEGRPDTVRTAPRSSPRVDVSNLAAQNDQFAEAMSVKRRGDAAAALTAFDRFLAMYPTSHLAENALAERMKLLASTDRPAARAAARQYLQKYPSGFACDDARAILASSARPPLP